MKNNKFLRKIKNFITRNSYALAIMLCVTLAITLISVAVVNSSNTGEDNIIVDNQPFEPSVPTGSDEIVLFTSPIKGATVTKGYAEDHLLKDDTTGIWQTHQAVDYKADEGTKVLAVYDGTVESVQNSMMDGLIITIKHSKNLKSVYKCLGDNALVNEGDKVVKGQEIGVVSSNLTEKADGIHLHFELYEADKLIDPTPYFAEEGK